MIKRESIKPEPHCWGLEHSHSVRGKPANKHSNYKLARSRRAAAAAALSWHQAVHLSGGSTMWVCRVSPNPWALRWERLREEMAPQPFTSPVLNSCFLPESQDQHGSSHCFASEQGLKCPH